MQVVGYLLYLAVWTLSNILFSAGKTSRKNKDLI